MDGILAPRPAPDGSLAALRPLDAAESLPLPRFFALTALFWTIAMGIQIGIRLAGGSDYVGIDPDDVMRLVEVRDYLGGQGWFDLTQYRLGPDGGTLMHWSRLVDWPIAQLIRIFGLFFGQEQAEAAALAAWPLLLLAPLLASTGLACYRLAGRTGMLTGLILALTFLAATVRFRPGAIDHHNVQLVLMTFMAAMLLDPLRRASNFAAAAAAGALALATGAETTPLVAVAAVTVALLWAVHGQDYRRAAIGFGATFAFATGAVFAAVTPPDLWASVTCDTLSAGYLALSVAGGLLLAASAAMASLQTRGWRFGALALTGVALLALALVVAPECLRSPLDDLDPLLRTYWISSVREAQSIAATLDRNPADVGALYAVGAIASMLCLWRILRRQQTAAHSVLLGLIAMSWLVSAVQVRGMLFANYLAFVPLSALIADLRARYLARRDDLRAAAAFAIAVLLSVPTVWSVLGELAFDPPGTAAGRERQALTDDAAGGCVTADTVAAFTGRAPGRVLATFSEGPALLRFTPHSVLGGNYHRNQAGMVASIRIGMAPPDNALALLQAARVRYLVLCESDLMARRIASEFPSGLFSRLFNHEPPAYLRELPRGSDGPRIYEMTGR